MNSAAATLTHTGLETIPLASGELLISGYLTRWDELDREADRMVRGSFAKSIPAFLAGNAPLCYAHRSADVIGRVVALEEDRVGVKMTAKVMAQPESSPLRWVYDAVRAGYLKSLSVGAIFRRQSRPDGSSEIVDVDIVESSITATPVLRSTGFEVISEGKAIELGWLAGERADLHAAFAVEANRRLDMAELRLDVAALLRA